MFDSLMKRDYIWNIAKDKQEKIDCLFMGKLRKPRFSEKKYRVKFSICIILYAQTVDLHIILELCVSKAT